MSLFVESERSDSLTQLKGRFLEKTGDVCVLPHGVVEAFRLSADPECDVEKFAKAIESDVNLAVEVLRLANSPLFSCSPVANLKQAAIRLGLRRCRNLVISSCVSNMTNQLPLEAEWARDVLNKHGLITGTVCSLINQEFKLGFLGEEYSAGLLHDFGRLALAATLVDEFPEFDDLSFFEDDEITNREHEVLGTNHCEFGAWFVESVSFPSELVDVVRWHHHGFGHASLKNQPLLSLTRAGDHFANYLQRDLPVEEYDVRDNKGLRELADLQHSDKLITDFVAKKELFIEAIHKAELLEQAN